MLRAMIAVLALASIAGCHGGAPEWMEWVPGSSNSAPVEWNVARC